MNASAASIAPSEPRPQGSGPRATVKQLRALHAAARQKGLTHEDLRAVCGVASLKELTLDDANRVLARLNADRPDGTRSRSAVSRRLPRLQPGVIRSATANQRAYIGKLLEKLGRLDHPPDWLWSTYHIKSVADDAFDTRVAHKIIQQLYRWCAKEGRL